MSMVTTWNLVCTMCYTLPSTCGSMSEVLGIRMFVSLFIYNHLAHKQSHLRIQRIVTN
jgi:hypothetical protein